MNTKRTLFTALFLVVFNLSFFAQANYEKDTIPTSDGDLTITFIGHGTLLFEWNGKVIHIDPCMREADYSQMPKADLILITHEHGDHLDSTAISHILKKNTKIVLTSICAERVPHLKKAKIMQNGDTKKLLGIRIEAIPAYNLVHKRKNGEPFHPKGRGNGYVLTIGQTRILIAADTENIPEIKALKNIDIAFLPMNLPYTMTPEMLADAAKAFQPKVLYPYHYGKTNMQELIELLKNEKAIDLRIRQMQ